MNRRELLSLIPSIAIGAAAQPVAKLPTPLPAPTIHLPIFGFPALPVKDEEWLIHLASEFVRFKRTYPGREVAFFGMHPADVLRLPIKSIREVPPSEVHRLTQGFLWRAEVVPSEYLDVGRPLLSTGKLNYRGERWESMFVRRRPDLA